MDQRRRRAEKTGKVFRRLASDVHRYRGSSVDRIGVILGAAVDSVGGLGSFARLWKHHLDLATDARDYRAGLSHLRPIGELIIRSSMECRRVEQQTLDHATDDELVEERNKAFIGLLIELGETDQDARAMVERIYARYGMDAPGRRAGHGAN